MCRISCQVAIDKNNERIGQRMHVSGWVYMFVLCEALFVYVRVRLHVCVSANLTTQVPRRKTNC